MTTFTNSWFEGAKANWYQILHEWKPQKILEVGSYEGASMCFAIKTLSGLVSDIELHCVDTWEGGVEHAKDYMPSVERRFHSNINEEISNSRSKIDFYCHKSRSVVALSKLIAKGKSEYFDFVYIDGSHQAPDVLTDAVLAFELTRPGGIIIFDDYLWSEEGRVEDREPLRCPKMAIDQFTNTFFRKTVILGTSFHQLYVKKILV